MPILGRMSTETLSEKQGDTLKWWVSFERESRVPPTYVEATTGLGVTHTSTIQARVSALVRAGYLEWNPSLPKGSSRSVRATEKGQQWAAEQETAA